MALEQYQLEPPVVNMNCLPECCLKLEFLHITVPVDVSTQDLCRCNKLTHVIRFIIEYNETKWEDWFSSYWYNTFL